MVYPFLLFNGVKSKKMKKWETLCCRFSDGVFVNIFLYFSTIKIRSYILKKCRFCPNLDVFDEFLIAVKLCYC